MSNKQQVLGVLGSGHSTRKAIEYFVPLKRVSTLLLMAENPLLPELLETFPSLSFEVFGTPPKEQENKVTIAYAVVSKGQAVKSLIDLSDLVVMYDVDRERFARLFEYAAGKRTLDFEDLAGPLDEATEESPW